MARNPMPPFESLLLRIRDGRASADDVALARERVKDEARLPEALREVVDFVDDPAGDAAGLLSVLGADDLFGDALRAGLAAEVADAGAVPVALPGEVDPAVDLAWLEAPWAWSAPVADAVRAGAGSVSVADAVVAAVGGPSLAPVADAVRAEAGSVSVADAVVAAVGGPSLVPVADAVRAEAGGVQAWEAVQPAVSDAWLSALLDHELAPAARRLALIRLQGAPQLGAQMTAFASVGGELRVAVRGEAGPLESVWGQVAQQIGVEPEQVEGWDGVMFAAAVRAEAGEVQLVEAVQRAVTVRRLPFAAVEVEAVPAPANRGRWSRGATLVALAAAFLIMALPGTWQAPAPVPAAVTLGAPAQFAMADEIVVEALAYGERANVTQATGDAGALILWVDEGVTL